ncbi:MAG TPA: molybdopterin cofactor-binding domain-containing protein, partial [Xanthobacteraceae bacterium]|nr:molybdopterin cofactor-binding domain-containing protein [Xanthobacteraceae bacterium]
MPRLEDFRLITGQGRYTDDLAFPDQTYGYFLRSTHAHARIVSIDTAAAKAMDGVIAVFTAEDFVASGARGVNQGANPAGVVDFKIKAFGRDGSAVFERPHLPFARDKVRYVGEPVAMVIATSVAKARDACEAVAIDYDVLPAVVDAADALKPGAPQVFEEVPRNCAVEHAAGDKARLDAAFVSAHLVVEETFRTTRAVAVQMEPRSHIGRFDAATGMLTFLSGTQGAVRVKTDLAYVLNLESEKVHVITQDVGGAFGLRTHLNPEQVAVAWAAHQLKRTVKWTSDRTEAFLCDYQGRDMVTVGKLAFDEKGKMLGLSIDMIGNVGGHPVSYVFLNNAAHVQPTVYDFPCAYIRLRGALTNT